jgi:hypothetical protein
MSRIYDEGRSMSRKKSPKKIPEEGGEPYQVFKGEKIM